MYFLTNCSHFSKRILFKLVTSAESDHKCGTTVKINAFVNDCVMQQVKRTTDGKLRCETKPHRAMKRGNIRQAARVTECLSVLRWAVSNLQTSRLKLLQPRPNVISVLLIPNVFGILYIKRRFLVCSNFFQKSCLKKRFEMSCLQGYKAIFV